jgi:hypothetical protein
LLSFHRHLISPIRLTPDCLSGEELLLLARSLPGQRQIIGVDLAPGMVDLAQQRIAQADSAIDR